MARAKRGIPDLADRAVSGAVFEVRATPRASSDRIEVAEGDGPLRGYVTAPPADGRANDALRSMLARALGVQPSRLSLIRGATSRDKAFRLD